MNAPTIPLPDAKKADFARESGEEVPEAESSGVWEVPAGAPGAVSADVWDIPAGVPGAP